MTYVVNKDRGEVELELDGARYPMRPSYEAQIAIEEALGESIEALWIRGRAVAEAAVTKAPIRRGAGLTLRQMSVIIVECANAAGRDRGEDGKMLRGWSVDQVAEKIVKYRYRVNASMAALLNAALFGGADPKKVRSDIEDENQTAGSERAAS